MFYCDTSFVAPLILPETTSNRIEQFVQTLKWSAPRELESYFPRISTGRSAGFMFTRASSNSFGGT